MILLLVVFQIGPLGFLVLFFILILAVAIRCYHSALLELQQEPLLWSKSDLFVHILLVTSFHHPYDVQILSQLLRALIERPFSILCFFKTQRVDASPFTAAEELAQLK